METGVFMDTSYNEKKLHENIFYGSGITDRVQLCHKIYFQLPNKTIMFLALCVFCYVTVSLKYLNQLTSYKVHMTIFHKYLLATFKGP